MMEAVLETTGGLFPAHTYLLDSNNLVAYIKSGTTEPFYFKNPIKGFSKSGRKFAAADQSQFKQPKKESNVITVTGSKGQQYTVDPEAKSCTCPGWTYRGTCRHLAEYV
jgi:hypothetical protein